MTNVASAAPVEAPGTPAAGRTLTFLGRQIMLVSEVRPRSFRTHLAFSIEEMAESGVMVTVTAAACVDLSVLVNRMVFQ